jgi:sugar phosphate isomerase/epimerase
MIRLAALLPAASHDEALAMAARLGIWGTGVAFAETATEAEAAAVGRRYRDAGLAIVQVGNYQNVASPLPEVRQRAARRLARSLELATAAGALAVVTGAGHCDPDRAQATFAAHPDNFSPEALERLCDTCRRALEAAPGATARLLVETWVISPLNSLLRASEAVRRVAHPRFGILFDPVNLMNLDNYFDNGSFLRRAVQQLGTAIGLVHAKDTLLHPERFTFQLAEEPVGRGALEYGALLEALDALPGDVPLCVEHVRSEAEVAEALAHLRGVAARRGVALG